MVMVLCLDNTAFIVSAYFINYTINYKFYFSLGLETFSQLIYQDAYGTVSITVIRYLRFWENILLQEKCKLFS